MDATSRPEGTRKPTRGERHRKRVRDLAVELRRQHLTAMKALERFVAEEDADDEGGVAIHTGDLARMPRAGNVPPRSITGSPQSGNR